MNARRARQKRATKHLPRILDLMFPRLALDRLGSWASDEHTVTRALAPMSKDFRHRRVQYEPNFRSGNLLQEPTEEQERWLEAMLRTGSLYVIDTEGAKDAVTDAIALALSGDNYEMPPLPTARVLIEGTSINSTWTIPAVDGFHLSIDGVAIDEVERGQHWKTLTLFYPVSVETGRILDVPGMSLIADVVLHDGRFLAVGAGFDHDAPQHPGITAIEAMYATLVNLITADKISVSNWPTDKQQPGLKLTTHFPRLAQPYWVSMADSGSTARGASDRTYHCRWLVSGHWRHYRTGDKTWIRAYVKGPKGAPWKGRPVHLLRKAGVA